MRSFTLAVQSASHTPTLFAPRRVCNRLPDSSDIVSHFLRIQDPAIRRLVQELQRESIVGVITPTIAEVDVDCRTRCLSIEGHITPVLS